MQNEKVIVAIPELPGFAGDVKNEGSLKIIMAAQYRTINRGGSSIYEEIRKAGYEPYVTNYTLTGMINSCIVQDGLYPFLPLAIL